MQQLLPGGGPADHQHRAALVRTQHARRQGGSVPGLVHRGCEMQQLGERSRRLLRAPLAADVERVEPPRPAARRKQLGEALRAPLTLGRNRRIVDRSRVLLARRSEHHDCRGGTPIHRVHDARRDQQREQRQPQGREERASMAGDARRLHDRNHSVVAAGTGILPVVSWRREARLAQGGQTTVIQRILERRAERPAEAHEGTTATVAVMLRVLPAPKALLAFRDPALRTQLMRRIAPDVLEIEPVASDEEALQKLAAEYRPVVVTDSLELIRQLRLRRTLRNPFVLYVAGLDQGPEREAGLAAGADECVGRHAPEREIDARIAAVRRIAELEAALRVTLEENRKLAATDDLTRVASRRFFGKHFPREVERAARYQRALALILCDIDFFKNINDTMGHACGDDILRQFSARLQEVLRRGVDWVARIGGEEFAVVLPETGYEPALEVARKLRAAVAASPFPHEGKEVSVTASFGLCGLDCVPAGERELAGRVLKIADAALYRSKQSGRNRVTATHYNGPSS